MRSTDVTDSTGTAPGTINSTPILGKYRTKIVQTSSGPKRPAAAIGGGIFGDLILG